MTEEPIWIPDELVHAIHRSQIARHGGLDGVRDHSLLSSALDKPKNQFHYGNGDMIQLAASYAYGISRNHPFLDGNKRTALVVCFVFLEMNGHHITASLEECYLTFLKLGAGELTEDALAEWLKAHSNNG